MNRLTAVLFVVFAACRPTPTEPECLAYLAADVAFHAAMSEANQIEQAIQAAIDIDTAEIDTANLIAAVLESTAPQDTERWKAYLDAALTTERVLAQTWALAFDLQNDAFRAAGIDPANDARTRRAAYNLFTDAVERDIEAAMEALASDLKNIGRSADFDIEEAEAAYNLFTDAVERDIEAAMDARTTAHRDAWVPAARASLLDAYAGAYAAGGRDIADFDIEAVFSLAYQERRLACPAVGNPELPEPLEFLARP